MTSEAPQLTDERRDEQTMMGGNSVLTALIEQMHRNWDQGDYAANDDLVIRIREHIRSQR